MHIPDGFLGPQTWLPAYGAAGAGWAWALRGLRRDLRADTAPRLGVVAACSFVLMLVAIPLPGGTSAHLTGVGMIAVLFGVRTGYLAVSLVLALQALMLGDGGVTALPVSSLALGGAGVAAAAAARRLLRPLGETVSLFAAGWFGVVAAAIVTALALGLQPVLAHDTSGEPLFFPFGLATTLPAVVVPHLMLGVLEGIVTVLAWRGLGPRTSGDAS
jgi:cobalt/nickel transport system permease protein